MFKTKDLVKGGLLIAIGILIPSIFHFGGINGSIFLPMHIPVLISGFILGPALGSIVGFLTPFLNHVLTGMPPTPILWIMLVELTIYGLISGLTYKNKNLKLMPSLIISMIGGRIGAVLALIILQKAFNIPLPNIDSYLYGITISAIPGIIIQIILIPILMKAYRIIDK